MPKSERDEILTALTSRIFSAMLDELVMDSTLQSHLEVTRGRTLCTVCNTHCGSIHVPGNNGSSQLSVPVLTASGADTPSSSSSQDLASKVNRNGSLGTGTSTPTNAKDGTLFFECVSCSRQIASNRYAPHLSSCMGLNTTRRGAVRGNVKSKQASDAGRSASPASDGGNASDDRTDFKGKAKAKGKRAADESDFTLKRKRPESPHLSPSKKSKKGKVSGSPVARVRADPDSSGLPGNSHGSPATISHLKIPSKLRASSTASFLEQSSTSSRGSSPGAVSATTPSSSFSSHSPVRPPAGNGKPSRGRPHAMGTGPPKRPSPPRPQAIHVPDYSMDIDHANETGSSTDTDGH